MVWLEMRSNNMRYNPGWNFSGSVWAPEKNQKGRDWPFWSLIAKVVIGDTIFHLRDVGGEKLFAGYSTALTDGYLTDDVPTGQNHEWDFSQRYYKAELGDFKEFEPKIILSTFFANNNEELRGFFGENRLRRLDKKHIFYVIQRGRLQCLNGAYFSEFDGVLLRLLIGGYAETRNEPVIAQAVNTGVTLREVEQRVGHQLFSDNVKENFYSRCCFPNCEIEDRAFLISSHIARWADNDTLRGYTSNGLCLCLMHDKAFEKGYFTLDEAFRVRLVRRNIGRRAWLINFLNQGENQEIKQRRIDPLLEALRDHRTRIGFEGLS
jgi:hypothetical protein